jgi:NADPH-dependent ferric siderophore reductase
VVEVRRTERRSPRLVRVTLAGDELAGLRIDQPAASVRLLLPSSPSLPRGGGLVIPTWNGNQFLLPDGRRPVLRTLTPRRFGGPSGDELDVEIVLHGPGAASAWAESVAPGAPAAISGPARGFDIDPSATRYVLAGDETAIPAISQLLEWLPPRVAVDVHIEVASADAQVEMPNLDGATVMWHVLPPGASTGDAFVSAVRSVTIEPGTRVWVAGEAAAVQRVRRYLFDDLGIPRGDTWVRGYWKEGRAGEIDG